MRPKQLVKLLTSLAPTRRPLFVQGKPGIGKSSIFEQVARQLGVEYLDVRLFLHDPSDFKFPLVDTLTESVKWVQSIFPTDPDWKGIIVLEELPQAPPLIQNVASPVLLERRLGEYTLPEGAWVVACGNRQQDRAGANRLLSQVLDRLIVIDLEESVEDWMAWAYGAEVRPEVISYLNFRPAQLCQFDPSQPGKTPTPRGWHIVSDVLPRTPAECLFEVVKGTVGEGAAPEFLAFLKTYRDLPDLDKLLADPKGFKLPTDLSITYALVGALVEKCRSLDAKRLDAVVQIAGRLDADFAVLLMRDAFQVSKDIRKVPSASAWLRAHRDVLIPGAEAA